jgi:hypothetical protein
MMELNGKKVHTFEDTWNDPDGLTQMEKDEIELEVKLVGKCFFRWERLSVKNDRKFLLGAGQVLTIKYPFCLFFAPIARFYLFVQTRSGQINP